MQQFLQVNMRGEVILNIMLPPLTSDYRLETFKVSFSYNFFPKIHPLDYLNYYASRSN